MTGEIFNTTQSFTKVLTPEPYIRIYGSDRHYFAHVVDAAVTQLQRDIHDVIAKAKPDNKIIMLAFTDISTQIISSFQNNNKINSFWSEKGNR